MKRKYRSLEELLKAYKLGELSEDTGDILQIDNDTCFVYCNDEKVFEGDPEELLEEALELLGIPAEHV